MATAPSLFGATPESIQQARDAALNAQATSYANMDPFQRANFGIYKGANQLGGAIGGMLGAQDPEMQRAQQRKALVQGLDLTNPQALYRAAQQASDMGDMQVAQELVARASAIAKTAQEARTAEAQVDASKATTAAKNLETGSQDDRVSTLIKAGFDSLSAPGIASNPAAFADAIKAKNVPTTTEYAAAAARNGITVHANMGAYTQEQMTVMTDWISQSKIATAQAGRNTTVIPLGDMFDKMAAKEDSKVGAASWEQAGEAYAQQVPMLSKLDSVLQALPSTTVGSFANTVLSASKFAAALGVQVDPNKMANAEYLNAVSSQVLQTIARNFPGSQSNKDLEALKLSKFSLTQQLPTIIKIIKDIRMEMGANVKTYEKLSRLSKTDRYSTNVNTTRAGVYRQMEERKNLDAKLKTGNYTIADVDKLRALDEELK